MLSSRHTIGRNPIRTKFVSFELIFSCRVSFFTSFYRFSKEFLRINAHIRLWKLFIAEENNRMLILIRPIQSLTSERIRLLKSRGVKHNRIRISKTRMQSIIYIALSRKSRSSGARTISLSKHINAPKFRLIWKGNRLAHQCKSASTGSTHCSFSSKFRTEHRHTNCDFIFSLKEAYFGIFHDLINDRGGRRHRIGSVKVQSACDCSLCNELVSVHKLLRSSDCFTTVYNITGFTAVLNNILITCFQIQKILIHHLRGELLFWELLLQEWFSFLQADPKNFESWSKSKGILVFALLIFDHKNLFQIVDAFILAHCIGIISKEIINLPMNKGLLLIRNIEKKAVIISFDDRGVFFVTKHGIAFLSKQFSEKDSCGIYSRSSRSRKSDTNLHFLSYQLKVQDYNL